MSKTDIKAMTNDNLSIDEKITKKELEEKIEKMKADKEAKCKAAKEQLVNMLEVTVDKYRTATGTAEALRVLRFATEDYMHNEFSIQWANVLAHRMSDITTEMTEKAKKLDYDQMDKLCEGFYSIEFYIDENDTHTNSIFNLAEEMMRIDLCRNVGSAAEDMVEFIKRVDQEIEDTQKALDELTKE